MRGEYEITADILAVAKEPSSKTSIVYSANLSFGQADRYLEKCLEEGLIESKRNSNKKYQTTEKGKNFLEAFIDLEQVIEK